MDFKNIYKNIPIPLSAGLLSLSVLYDYGYFFI